MGTHSAFTSLVPHDLNPAPPPLFTCPHQPLRTSCSLHLQYLPNTLIPISAPFSTFQPPHPLRSRWSHIPVPFSESHRGWVIPMCPLGNLVPAKLASLFIEARPVSSMGLEFLVDRPRLTHFHIPFIPHSTMYIST